jgi:superfamily II DNA or RNA helicase
MSTNHPLRPYQEDVVKAVMANIKGKTRDMVHSPTGSGKTKMIGEIIRRLDNQQILLITPRIRLLEQTLPYLPRGHGVNSGQRGSDCGSGHSCVIGTFQSLIHRSLKKPDVIIIDECHLVPPNSRYSKLLNSFSDAKIIGFTATPTRGNESIEMQGWRKIHEVPMQMLIDLGYLTRPRSMATHGTGYSIGNDDIAVTDEILGNLRQTVTQQGQKKILVFCKNIEHARFVEKRLLEAGEQSVFIAHSQTNKYIEKAESAYQGFADSPGRSWLINVSMVTLGIDIPCIDTIAILRDVQEFSLLVQMIGRGLRPFGTKKECLIFDFGRGTKRFGFIDDPQFKVSENCVGRTGESDNIDVTKECPECGSLIYRSEDECPYCGHQFITSSNLSPNAEAVKLLSPRKIGLKQLTISDRAISEVDGGTWKVEYFFKENSQAFARSFHRQKPRNLFSIGKKVVTKLVAGNMMQILLAS